MRYHALAADYDGTLALHGNVDAPTCAALERLRDSGRKLILVTGRQLDDLLQVFSEVSRFDCVVAENGALLYWPATREEKSLGAPPPAAFGKALAAKGVEFSQGRVIVASWEPHEQRVLEAIHELGLELQVIFNKGAVMVLPSGINKATGLRAALGALDLSPHNVVAVGDAENDHAFLSLCESAVAVANALPIIKEHADWVTEGDHGAGVAQLIEALLATDLGALAPRLRRHELLLGHSEDGQAVCVSPYGQNVLLVGTSGSGKSTFATAFLERLGEHGYQYCVIDPEGDYEQFAQAVSLGDHTHPPNLEEVLDLLARPDANCVVNLIGVGLEHRPAYFESLFFSLLELRGRTGRPHWIIADETHHLLPADWSPMRRTPTDPHGLMLITVHPDHVSPAILSAVDLVVIIGESPARTIKTFCRTLDEPPPALPVETLNTGEAIAWWRKPRTNPILLRSIPPTSERRRHVRKYARGELGADRSFYFRGPEEKLNLQAQNLMIFLQLAAGVDDATWLHHLRQGDYSRWFRDAIKDQSLAISTAAIERTPGVSAKDSRALIRKEIEERYTGAA